MGTVDPVASGVIKHISVDENSCILIDIGTCKCHLHLGPIWKGIYVLQMWTFKTFNLVFREVIIQSGGISNSTIFMTCASES